MANEGASQGHLVFRILQVLTLVPAWALMSAIINWYNSNTIGGGGAPGGVLCLFIVTLLASVWAFCILIATQRAGNTALSIAFTDFLAMVALIAAVATTSNIANYKCNAVMVVGNPQTTTVYTTSTGERISTNDIVPSRNGDPNDEIWNQPDYCGLLKGAWGLAIANIIMFFITAILSAVICRQNDAPNETVIVEERSPPPVLREKYYVDDFPQRPRRSARSHRSSRSRPRSQTYIIGDAV